MVDEMDELMCRPLLLSDKSCPCTEFLTSKIIFHAEGLFFLVRKTIMEPSKESLFLVTRTIITLSAL